MASVKIRDFINEYGGSKYGYSNNDIGWDQSRNMVTLGGQDLITPDYLESGPNGRSFMDSEQPLIDAIDSLAKGQGRTDLTALTAPINSDPLTTVQPPALPQFNYQSEYQANIDALYEDIMNTPAFSYDPNTDSNYQALKNVYTANGNRAMTNTMATAAGMTGGMPSSYAVGAGQGAFNQHMQQLDGMIPELQQLAYGMYMDGLNAKRDNLNTMIGLDKDAYGRARDLHNDSVYSNETDYNRAIDARDWQYGLDRDAIEDDRYNKEWDYGLERDAIEDTRYETEWAHEVEQDEIANNLAREKFNWTKTNSGGSGGNNSNSDLSEAQILTNMRRLEEEMRVEKYDPGTGRSYGEKLQGDDALYMLAMHKDEYIAEYGPEAYDRFTEEIKQGADNREAYEDDYISQANTEPEINTDYAWGVLNKKLKAMSDEEALQHLNDYSDVLGDELGKDIVDETIRYYEKRVKDGIEAKNDEVDRYQEYRAMAKQLGMTYEDYLALIGVTQ